MYALRKAAVDSSWVRCLLVGFAGYHEEWGEGEPVLLLHGGFCSLEALRPLGDALAPDFRVHAAERPGHGRTPDRRGPYDYADMVTDTVAYLDALGVGSAHVVGHSDGGIVGLLLARDHPGRVRSLVAISANLHTDAWVADDYPHTTLTPEAYATLSAEYARLSPDGAEHADAVVAKLAALWERAPDIEAGSLAAVAAPTLVLAGRARHGRSRAHRVHRPRRAGCGAVDRAGNHPHGCPRAAGRRGGTRPLPHPVDVGSSGELGAT